MISPKARPYYEPMIDDLMSFYHENQTLNDGQLFLAVSKTFGDRMLKEVCPFLGLELGECTIAAIDLMREESVKMVPH